MLRAGGAAGVSKAQHRLRGLFIVVQVALALCLLVCSGLLLRNLQALRGTSLGFSPDNLLTTELYLSTEQYKGRNILADFYTPLLERVRAVYGVTWSGRHQHRPSGELFLLSRTAFIFKRNAVEHDLDVCGDC